MKKIILAFVFVCFLGLSFAQETNDSGSVPKNYLQPGEVKIINQDLYSENTSDLQAIQSRFCNSGTMTRDLKLQIRPGQQTEICMAFMNQSDHQIDVLRGFTEGLFNKEGTLTCGSDNTGNAFSQQIIGMGSTGMTIPARKTIVKKVQYISPKYSSGEVYGCFSYKINKQEQLRTGEMFLIVPRKVGYIDISITGSVYNPGIGSLIGNVYNANKQIILKIIIGVLLVWIILTVVKTKKKPEKKHNK